MIKVSYLEILETRKGEVATIFFRGEKRRFRSTRTNLLTDVNEREKLKSAVNHLYMEIKHISFDKTERLLLAERLSGCGWTLKTPNFSCVTKSDMTITFIYRDLWEI